MAVKKLTKKNIVTFGKLLIAVYALVLYTSCTCMPSWLEYNSLFVGPDIGGVRGMSEKFGRKSVDD